MGNTASGARRGRGGSRGSGDAMDESCTTKEQDPASITPIGRDENGQLTYQPEHLLILDRLGTSYNDDETNAASSLSPTQRLQHQFLYGPDEGQENEGEGEEEDCDEGAGTAVGGMTAATTATPQRQQSRRSTMSAAPDLHSRPRNSFRSRRERSGRRRNCGLVVSIVILSFVLVLLLVILSVVVLNSSKKDEIVRNTPPPTLEPSGTQTTPVPTAIPTSITTAAFFPTFRPTTVVKTTSLPTPLSTSSPSPNFRILGSAPPATSPPSLVSSQVPISCPICSDGTRELEEPYKSTRLFPFIDQNSQTCGTLATHIESYVADEAAKVAATEGPEAFAAAAALACLGWQVTASMRCGCRPYPHPQAHCPLCPDGSLPSTDLLDRKTPQVDDNSTVNLTCSDLIWSAAVLPANAAPCHTEIVPKWAPYCGCPGYRSNEPNPAPQLSAAPTPLRAVIPPASRPTPTPTLPGTPRTPCTSVCADGQPVAPEYENAFAVTVAGPAGNNLTCLEFQNQIQDFEDSCFLLELLGTYNCGCVNPHPEAVCSLCPGGGLPDPKDAVLDEIGTAGRPLTCQELWIEAARSRKTSERCLFFQSKYGSQCGCPPIDFQTLTSPTPTVAPTPTPPVYNCSSLCHDGSAPQFPNNLIFPEQQGSPTCAEFHIQEAVDTLATTQNNDPELVCVTTQIVGGARCGCPYPHPNQTCPLCRNGTPPPAEFLDQPVGPPSSTKTCYQWMLDLALDSDPLVCEEALALIEPACGCQAAVAINTTAPATITPLPSPPPPSAAALPTRAPSSLATAPVLTPTMAPSYPPTPTPTTPGPTLALTCTLCWDQSTPQNLTANFYVADSNPNTTTTITCSDLNSFLLEVTIASRLEEDASRTYQEVCDSLQLVASLRCGCPYPHPQQSCPFCGTKSPPDPDLVVLLDVPTGHVGTCGDIVSEVAWTDAESTNCTQAREFHEAACQC